MIIVFVYVHGSGQTSEVLLSACWSWNQCSWSRWSAVL